MRKKTKTTIFRYILATSILSFPANAAEDWWVALQEEKTQCLRALNEIQQQREQNRISHEVKLQELQQQRHEVLTDSPLDFENNAAHQKAFDIAMGINIYDFAPEEQPMEYLIFILQDTLSFPHFYAIYLSQQIMAQKEGAQQVHENYSINDPEEEIQTQEEKSAPKVLEDYIPKVPDGLLIRGSNLLRDLANIMKYNDKGEMTAIMAENCLRAQIIGISNEDIYRILGHIGFETLEVTIQNGVDLLKGLHAIKGTNPTPTNAIKFLKEHIPDIKDEEVDAILKCIGIIK